MSVTTSGMEVRSGHRMWRSAVELLSSMRFAISLLVVLAIASIIGTVLTQADPYPNYVNQFGPFWADIFRSLGLYTVYSAWWFMLILIFLVISVSLCVLRNGPKMIADMRSWKDKVREGSLRAFHHKGEFTSGAARGEVAEHLSALVADHGYQYRVKEVDGATLIAAKRGAFTKLGYIFAHVAIVVICIGGLLDGNLPIRLQMWIGDKSPIRGNGVIDSIGPEHRLPASNVSFRGNAWVPEGQNVSTAILNQPDGSLIQDLPFSIQLDKFIVDYYSTGMPKLFASDIVVIDHKTGARIPARVEVNEPLHLRRCVDLPVEFRGRRLEAAGRRVSDERQPIEAACVERLDRRQHAAAGGGRAIRSSSPIFVPSMSRTFPTPRARPTCVASRTRRSRRRLMPGSAPGRNRPRRSICITSGRRCNTRSAVAMARRANTTITWCR